jgi:hypothetical protein
VQLEEERRKAEEQALLNYKFSAGEVPAHVKEPLFAKMMEEKEIAKRLNHEARVAVRYVTVWCGVVRCGVVRCGAVWCGAPVRCTLLLTISQQSRLPTCELKTPFRTPAHLPAPTPSPSSAPRARRYWKQRHPSRVFSPGSRRRPPSARLASRS